MHGMRATRFIIMSFILLVGAWLVLWNLVDFLTTGLNEGIWNFETVTTAWPSILVGLIIIIIWWKLFRLKVF